MTKGFVIYEKSSEKITFNEDYSVSRLCEAAISCGIELSILEPSQFEMVVTRDDKKSVLVDDKPTSIPDFALPRMGSCTTYYAFSVIRQLEKLGVFLCNNAESIYAVKDKLYMHQILAHSKLPTPKTMLVKFPTNVEIVKREIGFPLVIKNVTGTHGDGIHLCENDGQFSDIMGLIYGNNEKANIIVQEFIEHSYGKDIRVFVVGGKVVGCMQRSSQNNFKANYAKGAKIEKCSLTPESEWLATETAKLLNLDIAGIDLLFGKDGFKVCEANSSPGFEGLEKVVGKHIAEDIMNYVKLRVGST